MLFLFYTLSFCLISTFAQIYNVRNFGAVGDGKTNDTKAVRDAMAAAERSNGGRVVFDEGYKFLTGCFNVSSNVVLDVRGTILASTDNRDFVLIEPLPWFGGGVDCEMCGELEWQSIVRSYNAQNITIKGGGTIDGQGEAWWNCVVHGKVNDSPPCSNVSRPKLVLLTNTIDIFVDNITFKNSPSWTFHLANTTNVYVNNLRIVAQHGSHNTDGIDIDCSVNVTVDNYFYDGGDDAIAVKSGVDYNGRTFGRTTENILVQNANILSSHGLTIGSEMSHGARNVTFKNIVMNGSDWGPYLRSVRGRGGLVSDITYSNISLYRMSRPAIMFDLNYIPDIPPTNATATPIFRNINLNNIHIADSEIAWHIDGLPESPFNNSVLYNITVVNTKRFMDKCDNVFGSCDNSTVLPSCPPCIVETCYDTVNYCSQYVGICNNPEYKTQLCSVCRKTCNLCSSC